MTVTPRPVIWENLSESGFTLIELSIVLVIIGLIVGGILVGQDLIRAAAVRAQVTQIEKFNTAVNTFYGKYGGLPGDLNATSAAQFGFVSRGTLPGEGDGNGIVDGNNAGAANSCGYCVAFGEPLVFWMDLTAAHLIDGNFSSATENNGTSQFSVSGTALGQFLPPAKIGNGNYVYVWSGGPTLGFQDSGNNGRNYFGLSSVTQFTAQYGYSSPGLTVQQAYAMDTKIDDGLPQSGRVVALYIDANSVLFGSTWAGSGGQTGAPYTTATSGSATTCFDNSTTASGTPGVAGATQHYSVEMNNGANVNCALSFQLQAGD